MSEWRTVELGDIADFSNGINFDKSAYTSGVPFIGVSNFGDRFSPPYDELEQVKTDIVRDSDYLQEGDIVFVRSNGNKELVGRCMLIRNCPRKVTFSGFCIRCRLRNPSEYDPVFFAYYFKSSLFRRAMSGTAIGANIQNLSQGRLSSHKVSIPDIASQHYIADILSAYDSLIETNQRQIKLLEEATQRLYREWFVDLRFPGHEDVPVVDGVPEGWTRGELGDIAEESGKKEKKENRNEYSYYLPIDCLPSKSLAYITENDIALAESSLVAFAAGDILFGAMRPYFHKVVVARDKGLTRTTCFVLNAKQEVNWSYLLMLLFAKKTIEYATTISVGTTMPYVRWKDFSHMPTMIPTSEVSQAFNNIVTPIVKQICHLAMSCEQLSEARDRLLPKLMSGEIVV